MSSEKTLGDTDAPLGVAGKPAAAVCLRVAVCKLTTALLYIQDQLQVQRHESDGGVGLLTAARSSTELISGLGRATAVPRRAMAMAVREKRMVAGVFAVFLCGRMRVERVSWCVWSLRPGRRLLGSLCALNASLSCSVRCIWLGFPSRASRESGTSKTPHLVLYPALANRRRLCAVLSHPPLPSFPGSLCDVFPSLATG